MQLSPRDQSVLQKLKGAGWISQFDLKTSRQTLNKLQRANLVERKIVKGKIRYLLESGALYRLTKMDECDVEKNSGNTIGVCTSSMRHTPSP